MFNVYYFVWQRDSWNPPNTPLAQNHTETQHNATTTMANSRNWVFSVSGSDQPKEQTSKTTVWLLIWDDLKDHHNEDPSLNIESEVRKGQLHKKNFLTVSLADISDYFPLLYIFHWLTTSPVRSTAVQYNSSSASYTFSVLCWNSRLLLKSICSALY